MNPTLALVGAGKVGATLGRLLAARGYHVETVYSPTPVHAAGLAEAVGAQATASYVDVRGDLALIAVPDGAITDVASALVGGGFAGRAAVHTSGVRGADALQALAARGVQVGSLHPAYPFADVETGVAGLPGAAFALEAADEPLGAWLHEIVAALDGRALVIPAGGKALYHAALCLASNYTVTLYALAESLLTGLGVDKAVADQALDALLAGTVENLRARGVPDALTGPLVRGDVGTVAAHLEALHGVNPSEVVEVYRLLARLTYPLLRARGIAPDAIEQLLRQDVDHAYHGS